MARKMGIMLRFIEQQGSVEEDTADLSSFCRNLSNFTRNKLVIIFFSLENW